MTSWTYPAVVERVIDADTLVCLADLGMHVHWRGHVRVLGVDAPELRTVEGQAARAFVVGLLPVGSVVTLMSQKLDAFGRALGQVWLADGSELGARLIEAGHAVPWS
jgi:endonuclease YncB( thermonuclease family)